MQPSQCLESFVAGVASTRVGRLAPSGPGEDERGEIELCWLANTIINNADYGFWNICRAGGLLVPGTEAVHKVRH